MVSGWEEERGGRGGEREEKGRGRGKGGKVSVPWNTKVALYIAAL